MSPAERFARMESSRSARATADVTTERRPMPPLGAGVKSRRLPSQARVVDFPASFSLASKPWLVVKVQEVAPPRYAAKPARVVLSAHSSQADANERAGEGRDALTDAEVGAGFNVVAERRSRGRK